MADETLYGCVDFTTGVITFTQDPDCEYPACVIWDGVHAGQMAVTVDTDNCDDTYYGYWDSVTGKFQVSIPDECCSSQCEWCDGYTTPSSIKVSLDATPCYNTCIGEHGKLTDSPDIDGDYIISQYSQVYPCLWFGGFELTTDYTYNYYIESPCNGDPASFTVGITALNIEVARSETKIRCSVYLVTANGTVNVLNG